MEWRNCTLIDKVLAEREQDELSRINSQAAQAERSAVHEAGHVVAAQELFGAGCVESARVNHETGAGETKYVATRKCYRSMICVDVAGFAAEYKFTGERPDVTSTQYIPDMVSFAKSMRARGSGNEMYTVSFMLMADAVREELFSKPDVWQRVLSTAKSIFEAPSGYVSLSPGMAVARRHDDRIKSMLTEQPTGFERLMKSNENFWRTEGCL